MVDKILINRFILLLIVGADKKKKKKPKLDPAAKVAKKEEKERRKKEKQEKKEKKKAKKEAEQQKEQEGGGEEGEIKDDPPPSRRSHSPRRSPPPRRSPIRRSRSRDRRSRSRDRHRPGGGEPYPDRYDRNRRERSWGDLTGHHRPMPRDDRPMHRDERREDFRGDRRGPDRIRDRGGRRDRRDDEGPLGRRDRERRERSGSDPRPGLSSSIGAVISHESDGDYDPEAMLKKSLASQIKVPERKRKPMEANKKLVLQAVAEADRSIIRRQREDRQRDEELEAIHAKRMQLSKAMRAGKLDEDKINEINANLEKKRDRKDSSRRDRDSDRDRQRNDRERNARDKDRDRDRSRSERVKDREIEETRRVRKRPVMGKMRADDEEATMKKRPKVQEVKSPSKSRKPPEPEPESYEEDDLRHQLGKRKKSSSGAKEKETLSPRKKVDAIRNSGLKICHFKRQER